ncbi:MAG: cob(I)yrinic acid a,c-diamide adenosyltransferase [Kiritimatiellae bacterium]|nr:cob(I)yrinic acid a,c-diamide adenosyltransferase [Kiritimatiellia bacterium]
MKNENTGKIQVYTGSGKGKTTAAFGLALRALGHHRRVCIIQFLKGGGYTGETIALRERFPECDLFQYGSEAREMTEASAQRTFVEAALAHAERALPSGRFDLIVLDEINVCLHERLMDTAQVLSLLERKAPHTEVILTGRHAPPELIARADLVTEMRKEKHYYDQGYPAREGIEF